MRRAAAVLAAAALLGVPAAARSQDPFTVPPAPTPTTEAPAAPQAPTNPNDDGLSGTQKALIFLSGGILLAGIAWAIVKDARRRAPVRDRAPAPAGPRGPDPHRERAKHRARRKQKLARAQRKRNR
jgi:hypothetical protein